MLVLVTVLVSRSLAQGEAAQRFCDQLARLALDEPLPEGDAALSALMKEARGNVSRALDDARESERHARESAEESSVLRERLEDVMEQIRVEQARLSASLGQATEGANGSAEVAKASKEVSEHTRQSLADISAAADQMGTVVQRLNSAVTQMGEMTTQVKAVAFQTNLLALNAAIEAARAGQAGRGFGVVAKEVRALSKTSDTEAASIEKRLSELQQVESDLRAVAKALTQRASEVLDDSRQAAHMAGEASQHAQQVSASIRAAHASNESLSKALAA